MLIEPAPPTAMGVTRRRVLSDSTTYLVDKLHGLLPLDAPDGADLLVVEQHAVEFVGCDEHFGAESRGDKLRGSGEVVNHSCRTKGQERCQGYSGGGLTCDGSTVLRI